MSYKAFETKVDEATVTVTQTEVASRFKAASAVSGARGTYSGRAEQPPSARRTREKMRIAKTAESDEPLFDSEFLRQRAITNVDGGIRVSAAVPTVEESRSIFGVDPDENGIQPPWLEIKNSSDRSIYLLPTGLDPEYFAPLEVAFLYKDRVADYGALGEHLQALNFDSRSPIIPGAEVAGGSGLTSCGLAQCSRRAGLGRGHSLPLRRRSAPDDYPAG